MALFFIFGLNLHKILQTPQYKVTCSYLNCDWTDNGGMTRISMTRGHQRVKNFSCLALGLSARDIDDVQ